MPDLSKFFPLSALQPFYDTCHAGSITEDWRTNYQSQLKTIVYPALADFFNALKEEGNVVPIPNSKGYACQLWNAWNRFAQLTSDHSAAEWTYALDSLAREFAHRLVYL